MTCIFAQLASAGTGVITASSTGEDDCPTSIGASIYQSSDPKAKILGAIADGTTVRVDLNIKTGAFYWIQGDGYSGTVSGYVYKTCVKVTSSDDPPSAPTRIVRIKPSTSITKPGPVQCEKFTDYLPGCKSFNDMIAAQDTDLLTSLTGHYQAYVCFRTGEDVFTVVSFQDTEVLSDFKRVTGTGMAETFGLAELNRYKDGVSEDSKLFTGKWHKLQTASNDAAYFSGGGLAANPSSIHVNASEVSVSYKWKNVSNTITTYTLQIRRSTKRGLETLEAPRPLTEKNKSMFQTTFQDFCEFYPNR
ncbi:MAG TPA: hypothetical protein VFQ41_24550 [Candidatus Angelobacter sp.]|nr:hypothetical protein [Candidatus Angelobacter sp.]